MVTFWVVGWLVFCVSFFLLFGACFWFGVVLASYLSRIAAEETVSDAYLKGVVECPHMSKITLI